MLVLREDLPELRGFAHLGANSEYGPELFDIKFYPYTQPRLDPVFAATGSQEIYICRPVCRDKKVIDVLRVYRDEESKTGCVFNSIAWTKKVEQKDGSDELTPLLCVAGQIPKIKILNILTGQIERTLIGHGRAINDLAVSPVDSNLLASCSGDSTIRLWNLTKQFEHSPCVGLLAGNHHEKDILSIDFHPSGRYLLAGGMDLKVTLWILPEFPDEPCKPEDTAYVMHPHFATRDVHVDMVDCVKFYGNKIFSRSAKSCQIVLWSIVGFDDYVDAYDTHDHACSSDHDHPSSSPTGQISPPRCAACDSCPLCNLPAPPPLSMDISTSSAFNLGSPSRSDGRHPTSTIGMQGETGIQILVVLDLPHSNLFYMRFGIYDPVTEPDSGRENRGGGQTDGSAGTVTPGSTPTIPSTSTTSLATTRPRARKGGGRKPARPTGDAPDYGHAVLCAGNERSRFFFWDLDSLETVRMSGLTNPAGVNGASGGERGGRRRRKPTGLAISTVPTGGSSTTSASASTAGSMSTLSGTVTPTTAAGTTVSSLRTIRAGRSARSLASYTPLADSIGDRPGRTVDSSTVGSSVREPSATRTRLSSSAVPVGTAVPSGVPPGLATSSVSTGPVGSAGSCSQSHCATVAAPTDPSDLAVVFSPLMDPAMPIPPHRTQTVSKINFTVRQIGWSVGGEWCVGCGDSGMLAVFGRA